MYYTVKQVFSLYFCQRLCLFGNWAGRKCVLREVRVGVECERLKMCELSS